MEMEVNGGGKGLEDELAMVVSSSGLVAWVPAQAVTGNGGSDAVAAAVAQDAWVPAEVAARTGWIPAPSMLVLDGDEALGVALQHGWIHPSVVARLARRNGADNLAASIASRGNPAIYLALLCLPAREIARCRRVCRLWRDITRTESFRRHHHAHHDRKPMPLFFFLDPKLARLDLRAVDIRDRVARPVVRFNRPSNHEVLRIHGSCAGILLLSSGHRLYACNPCTRHWARLPSIHVGQDIIGFYVQGGGDSDSVFKVLYHEKVLYHDGSESECAYWIFTLGRDARCIGRPSPNEIDRALANGIAPSFKIPPVFFRGFLHWPPKASQDNSIIIFDTAAEYFSSVPPPSIQVGDERVPVMGRQLFEIDELLAMTVISPERVDVWVRSAVTDLWSRRYSIRVPVDAIKLNDSCYHNGSVFAVAQDRNDLVQCPRILLQCDALGAVLQSYQLAGRWTSLSGHTIEESLLLRPSILPMRDRDAVDGDPPFFRYRYTIIFPW